MTGAIGAAPRTPAAAVLIVCEANVCRSPLIAFAASRSWPVSVGSAGLKATAGLPICPVVATHIASMAGGRKFIEDFRSQPLLPRMIGQLGLVLTVTTEMRGELVIRYPELRDRTFTVFEALALAGQPLSGSEKVELRNHGPEAVLLARRGLTAPARARRPGFPWRYRGSAWDVPDGHSDHRNRHHLATVELAAQAGAELGMQLREWRLNAGPAAGASM